MCDPPDTTLPQPVFQGRFQPDAYVSLQLSRALPIRPPPAVNFLPGLRCRVYMLIEKLKQYRKFYIIPLALPVKSPSVWPLWGWAIYYKCHITVAATFFFFWVTLCKMNQDEKYPAPAPLELSIYFLFID